MTDFQEKENESTRFKVTGADGNNDLVPIDTGDSAIAPPKDEGQSQGQNAVVYAGFWRRLFAAIADGTLLNLVHQLLGVLFFLLSFQLIRGLSISPAAFGMIILMCMTPIAVIDGAIALAGFECSPLRATPGKLMFNMQVTDCNFKPLTFLQALKKQLVYGVFYLITILFYFNASFLISGCDLGKFIDAGLTNTPAAILTLVFYLGGLIAPFIGKRKQTLVDLVSGRVVFLSDFRKESLFKSKDPPPFLNFKVAAAGLVFALFTYMTLALSIANVSSKVFAILGPSTDFHHSHPCTLFQEPVYTFINKDGSFLTKLRYEDADDFCQGMARVKKDKRIGFIDKSGNQKIPCKFDAAENFSEGLAAARENFGDQWGYIDKSGKYVIEPRFTMAFPFKEGLARVVVNNKTGYIEKKGNFLIEPIYENGGDFENGKALVRTGDSDKTSQTFIDRKGQKLFGKSFIEALPFSEGLAAVKPEGGELWGFIDAGGKMVIAPSFQFAESFSGGFCACALGDKWGIIDREGNFVIKAKSECAVAAASPVKISFPYPVGEATPAQDKLQSVKYGYISEDGSYAIKPTFDDAEPFIEGIARVGIRKPQKPVEH
ncbi:hypothetical protein GC174_17705 [bacterium]|nr:hypothetical protein [bacterium]